MSKKAIYGTPEEKEKCKEERNTYHTVQDKWVKQHKCEWSEPDKKYICNTDNSRVCKAGGERIATMRERQHLACYGSINKPHQIAIDGRRYADCSEKTSKNIDDDDDYYYSSNETISTNKTNSYQSYEYKSTQVRFNCDYKNPLDEMYVIDPSEGVLPNGMTLSHKLRCQRQGLDPYTTKRDRYEEDLVLKHNIIKESNSSQICGKSNGEILFPWYCVLRSGHKGGCVYQP